MRKKRGLDEDREWFTAPATELLSAAHEVISDTLEAGPNEQGVVPYAMFSHHMLSALFRLALQREVLAACLCVFALVCLSVLCMRVAQECENGVIIDSLECRHSESELLTARALRDAFAVIREGLISKVRGPSGSARCFAASC